MRKIVPIFIFFLISCSVLSKELVFLNLANDSTKSTTNNLPFSKATRVGELLFLSGELGIDPLTGKLVIGGIKAETLQLMKNISATLKAFDSSLEKVAKCTVFLADINEWPQFNQVYRTFFNGHFPARSAVAGSGLALSARVEVECIAVVN
jgi:2-iminobutanoate/2-iminopropanoate deaminase